MEVSDELQTDLCNQAGSLQHYSSPSASKEFLKRINQEFLQQTPSIYNIGSPFAKFGLGQKVQRYTAEKNGL